MKKIREKNINVYKWIVFILAIIALIPLFYISIYSRPSADDYSYSRRIIGLFNSGEANVFSVIKAAVAVDIYAWKNYDGPFISQIIMTLQPGIYGEKYYFIGAMGLIVLILLCLFGTFWNILKLFESAKNKVLNSVIFSFGLTALLLAGFPSLTEGIYWFDGAWNYLPFFFLSVLNVSLIFRYIVTGKSEIPKIVQTSFVSFVSCGGNYIVTYCNVILMFSLAVYALVKKKRGFIVPFILSLMGFALEFFAPGRLLRTENDMSQSSVIGAMIGAIKQTYIYLCEWVNIQFVLIVVIVVTLTIIVVPDSVIDKTKINPLWFYLYTVVMTGALFLLPSYATPGGFIAGRILNIIWMMFIFMTVIDFMYLSLWIRGKKLLIIERRTDCRILWILIAVLFFASCWFTESNSFKATRELLNGTAKEFARTNDIRYEMMTEASFGDELECEPLVRSEMLYFDDLDTNPNDWKNQAWKDYYGVGMHVVKNEQ